MYNFKKLADKETRRFCDHIAVMKESTVIYYAVYNLKKPLIKIQDKNKMMLINNPENKDEYCRNRIGTINNINRFIENPEYTGIIKLSDDIFYNKGF